VSFHPCQTWFWLPPPPNEVFYWGVRYRRPPVCRIARRELGQPLTSLGVQFDWGPTGNRIGTTALARTLAHEALGRDCRLSARPVGIARKISAFK
jgi:hypothetical protein